MIAEVLLTLASYHTNRDYNWNETNPGGGVNIVAPEYGVGDVSPVLSIGAYSDSYRRLARYALVGARYAPVEWFHTGIGVGYYEGSGYNGVGATPYVGVGYDKWFLNVTGTYCKDRTVYNAERNEYYSYTSSVCVFITFPILEW